MIYYTISLSNIFLWRGSVFPKSTRAALPAGIIAAAIRLAINEGHMHFMEADDSILTQTQAWAGFSVLVGFLIIFRSSQAYSRFWDGCTATHHMRADWFDAASALVAFTELSKAPKEQVYEFRHTIVRLISMMNSAALMDLEEMNNKWGTTSEVKADRYPLVDPLGIDKTSLDTLYESKERVMLIFQWIQLLIIRNMDNGVLPVPPPILSRAYQELAQGMVAFHECVKISDTPFPFPYAQNCDLLLILHWSMVPWVVSQWVTAPFWAFMFVFMQVFVLWSLNYIAVEIENPFGTDDNAIDGAHMQEEMNKHLLMLLSPKVIRTPTLSHKAIWSTVTEEHDFEKGAKSFAEIWKRKKSKRRRHKGDPSDTESTTIGSTASVASCGDSDDEEPPLSGGGGGGLRQEARSGFGGFRQDAGAGPPLTKAPDDMTASWSISVKESGKSLTEERVREHNHVPLDDFGRGGHWEALPEKGKDAYKIHSSPAHFPEQRRSAHRSAGGGGSPPSVGLDVDSRGRPGSARGRRQGAGDEDFSTASSSRGSRQRGQSEGHRRQHGRGGADWM